MSLLGIILAVVIGIVGLVAEGDEGLLFGALVGYCLGAVIQLTSQLGKLRQQLIKLENLFYSLKNETERKQVEAGTQEIKAEPEAKETKPEPPPQSVQSVQKHTIPKPVHETVPGQPTEPEPVAAGQRTSIQQRLGDRREKQFVEGLSDKLIGSIQSFFTDGNVVVKVGMLILTIGVGFLLKYGYEQQWFVLPMELRFAGAGLLGLVLVVFGWRLRDRKQIYALLLQGGGIGIMYLTVFGAAKFYDMIPIGMAFAVMICLVVFSAILAILQNARQLAFFGAIGGFLAPILLSTGSGNYIILFSYYALLNLGILSVAYYRSWRELNLLGFLFTFGVAGAWGAKSYRPELLASTEPFLILFFLMYVAIAVLFAFRQPPKLKGYIDSTLVFGVPIIVFGYQTAMVQHIEYAIAYSALTMAAFYIFLATILWRRGPEGMRLLTESFLAMGVVFGSLAIPLALDGRWTSAAWAMEGAALVWIGVRQHRLLPRLFGIVLQFGAGYFFLSDLYTNVQPVNRLIIINSLFLGGLIISLAGLFSSYYLNKHRDELRTYEIPLYIVLFVWGLFWWFAAGLAEVWEHVPYRYDLNASLLFITGSLLLGYVVQSWTNWRMMRFPVLGHLYVMLLFLLLTVLFGNDHPFEDYGWIIWTVAILLQYWFLYCYSNEVSERVMQWQHIMAFWLVLLIASWESAWLIDRAIAGSHAWRDVMFALTPAIIMLLLFTVGKRMSWPFEQHYKWYASHAATPVMIGLALLVFGFGVIHEGNPWPVNYIPLVNPVDLVVAFLMYLLILWRMQLENVDSRIAMTIDRRIFNYSMAALGFMWINGMVARTVHHWFGVRHNLADVLGADQFQGSISVIWTILALSVMVIASRRSKRHLWFVGLGLFIVVAAKLFLFDMGNANALTMAISITAVGIIAVVFGYYLSPLPPKEEEEIKA